MEITNNGKKGHAHTVTIPENSTSERIDTYLAQEFPDFSRSYFQRLVKKGLISVNEIPVTKPSLVVKAGDTITITFPPKPTLDRELLERKTNGVEVVYEHEHFFIINKPAGLMVHKPTAESTAITLVDWIVMSHKDVIDVGDTERPGIVHRLDKDTSGLLIIPRTNYAFTRFGDMFKKRQIHKTYLAVVQGHTPKAGIIDLPIGRHPVERHKMATFSSADLITKRTTIRTATTHYKVLEYFQTSTLLEVKLITGRTHQIRVHCAAIGHPLVGDPVYGDVSKDINRQALHAYNTAFTFDGKDFDFTKEPPEDFNNLVKKLRASTDPEFGSLLKS